MSPTDAKRLVGVISLAAVAQGDSIPEDEILTYPAAMTSLVKGGVDAPSIPAKRSVSPQLTELRAQEPRQ